MHKDFKDKINDSEEYIDESFPSIQFKIRRMKRNLRFCVRFFSIILLATISGTLLSEFIIRIKYQNIFNNVQNNINEGINTI